MSILKNKMGEKERHSRSWKGIDFGVYVVKDPNYNMIMMYTYSVLMVCDDQKEGKRLSRR